jgi:uncharacterized protein (TIGR03545 family)/uncharacterized protein (TIGR03546 family)
MDIFKLLKTLNSAQASWQISLALVLAMVSGFIPLLTPLYFIIIFIAFTLNIPLVVFFLMSGVFTGLATILDPTFAQIGKEILTAPSNKELFTQMYNYTPTLWSSFNHTVVMGSTIVALVLALPLFFASNTLLNKFRSLLEQKFKDSKYFSWLNPYSQEKLEEKPGVFRLWGGALFIALFGGLAALLLFVFDPALKYGLEFALSKASDKTVTIKSVESDIANALVKIENIAFYTNGASDVNVDKVELKLNIEHLLAKKLDIVKLSFGEIFLNLDLESTEQSTTTKEKKEHSEEKSEASSIEMPELPNVDDVIAKEGLKSVSRAKELQKELSSLEKKYKGKVSASEQKEQIASLEKRVKELEKKAKKIKSLDDVKSLLKEADAIKKESKQMKNSLNTLYANYKKDKALLQKNIKELKTLPKEDYENLKNKYSLDSNGAMNFVGTHFSSSLEEYLRLGAKYYEYIKPYLGDEEEEAEETKRLKGEWIKYEEKNPYPDFVIQKLSATVVNKEQKYALNVNDISMAQKLYKKPISGTLTGKDSSYEKLFIAFEHNELGEQRLTSIKSTSRGYKLAKYTPVERLSINDSLVNENSTFLIKEFSALEAKIDVDFAKTNILYSATKTLADKTMASIFSNIESFNIHASVSGSVKEPQVELSSDLDKKLSDGFKKELDKEKKKYRAQLKERVNQEFKKQLGEIDLGEFNDVEKLLSKDGAYSAIEQQIEKKFSKKALEKKYNDKAKNAAKDKLKSLKLF